MIVPLLQVLVTALLIAYAGFWRRQQKKRHSATWEEIVCRLQANDWGIEQIMERYLYKSGLCVTTQDIWERIAGARGLWAMYRNAPVLVQLADYAADHGESVDNEVLEALRSDAFQIRLSVLMALAQHVLSASSVGAAVNAHRATVAYSAMLVRLTEFVQQNSAMLFPRYLDAIA